MTAPPDRSGLQSLPPGTIDLHVHTAPDVVARRLDDLTLAEGGPGAGLLGAVLKSHDAPTAGRAWLTRRARPGFLAYGSVALNRAVGGLNPAAVDALARTGEGVGRIVWLPTRDAANERERKGGAGPSVAVTDGGRPVRALHEVAERAAAHGLILASGHLDPAEALAVFRAVRPLGGALLATHATAPVTPFSPEQVIEALDLGAWIEICARHLLARRADAALPLEDAVDHAAALIRRFGPERLVLSSDLGDPRFPAPAEGLAAAARALAARGVADAALEAMLVANPARLLGGHGDG